MAKNADDALRDEILQAARVVGLGNPLRAGSSGGSVTVPPSATTVQNGVPKDPWMWGDDWSSRYFFEDVNGE